MLVGRLVQGTINLSIGYGKILKMPARLLAVVCGGLLGNMSSENGEALVAEVSNSLRRHEADAALFNFVRTDSAIYPFILGSPGLMQRDYWPGEQTHWSMKLPTSIEAVYGEMSGDHRKELRRMERKLVSDYSGDVKVRSLREVADLDSIFRDLEEIAKRTYQRGLGAGFADTPGNAPALSSGGRKGLASVIRLVRWRKAQRILGGDLVQRYIPQQFHGLRFGLSALFSWVGVADKGSRRPLSRWNKGTGLRSRRCDVQTAVRQLQLAGRIGLHLRTDFGRNGNQCHSNTHDAPRESAQEDSGTHQIVGEGKESLAIEGQTVVTPLN